MTKFISYLASIIAIVLVFSLNSSAQVNTEDAISGLDFRIDKLEEMKANYSEVSPKYIFIKKYQDAYSSMKQGVSEGMTFEAAKEQYHTPEIMLQLSFLNDYSIEEVEGFKVEMEEMAALGKQDTMDYKILEMLVSINP